MRSNEILAALLVTIAHLESVHAAPLGDTDLSPIADKRDPSWVSLGEDALKGIAGGAGSAVGGELASEVEDGVESLVSNYARAPEKRDPSWASLGEDALKGLAGGAASKVGSELASEVETGVESLVSNYARAPEKRSPKSSSSSSGKTSSSSGKTSSSSGKTSSLTGLGGDVLSGLAGGAASRVGSELASEVETGFESLVSNYARAPEKRSPKSSSSSSGKTSSSGSTSESSSSGSKTSSLGSGIAGGIGSIAGSYLVDGVEDAWDALASVIPRAPEKRDAAGLTEEQRRSLWTSVGKDALKGLGTGAAKTVAEDAWEAVESMIPRAPEKRDAAGLTDEQKRSLWGTVGKEAAKGLGTGAAKTVAEDAWDALESFIPRAPEKRDAAGLTEEQRRSLWTSVGKDALKGLGTGAAKTVAEDAWDALESFIPRAPGDMRDAAGKRSTQTSDAPMAARSGIVDTIENLGEDALPYLEKFLPYGEEAVEEIAKREPGTQTDDAPLAARSGVWDDILEGLGVAGKVGLGLLEDE